MGEAKYLVIGGAGFIGSEVTRQLACEKAGITVVDNLANGKAENLADLPAGRVRLEVVDIRDKAAMAPLLDGIEVVFHLACLGVRHSLHSPEENHEVNATGTLQLLSAARRAGVKRFVCVSSSEVYGTALQVPMSEEHPAFPMTVYGAGKLAGEGYARAFYRTYGWPTVVVRPFNTYGPRCHHEGDSGEVIPKFMLRCMADQPMVVFGDGEQTRDFTHVRDTAKAIIMCGFSDAVVGRTINVGSAREITINELARQVAFCVGKPDSLIVHEDPRPGDTLRLFADTTLARRLLDFKPEITLKEGLEMLKDWYSSLGQPPGELLEQENLRAWKRDD